MALKKEARHLGMPWEKGYGYAQAVKVGGTIYVSGQLSHDDEGNMVGPAPVDKDDKIGDHGNMGIQMAQSYANAKKVLALYGATMKDVVEEVVYVTDMDAAFAVVGQGRAEAYGESPVVASTILVTPRLAFPNQLLETAWSALSPSPLMNAGTGRVCKSSAAISKNSENLTRRPRGHRSASTRSRVVHQQWPSR